MIMMKRITNNTYDLDTFSSLYIFLSPEKFRRQDCNTYVREHYAQHFPPTLLETLQMYFWILLQQHVNSNGWVLFCHSLSHTEELSVKVGHHR